MFVLLIGNKERGDVNHFQLLQEETAASEGRRLDFDVEVSFAPGFDQLRTLKRRLLEASVLTPANTGLALAHLHRFWTKGTPVPPRSFTEARPWPPASVPA